MIIGIGSDIVEHKLTEALKWDKDNDVIERIFSKGELKLYEAKANLSFLAGRFAGKEAVLKCLKIGMQDGISLSEIEILEDSSGAPFIFMSNSMRGISENLKIKYWHISISHTSSCSIAFVIAES